jgi:hypothetical protein
MASETGTETLIEDLRRADEALADVESEIAAIGEDDVQRVAGAHETLTDLLDRYETSATGTGRETFQSYVEFEGAVADFEERLDDDLPEREAFEAACEHLDRRRLDDRDFERAREALAPATGIADLLDEREEALERRREARAGVERRIRDVEDRIDDLEGTLSFADVDFDADLDPVRHPIEAYNDAVTDAFRTYKKDESAREVLDVVETAEAYPLVSFPPPPEELSSYLDAHEVGAETIPTLLEYADYSVSKLRHYVDDPGEFRAVVGSNRTYLDRLDADPLRIVWPPPEAGALRRRTGELVSVVGRFAPENVVARLRDVRAATERSDYDQIRRVARAREQLDEGERERLQSGEIEDRLSELREERERLRDALESFPAR